MNYFLSQKYFWGSFHPSPPPKKKYIYGPICYFSRFLFLSVTKSILFWIFYRKTIKDIQNVTNFFENSKIQKSGPRVPLITQTFKWLRLKFRVKSIWSHSKTKILKSSILDHIYIWLHQYRSASSILDCAILSVIPWKIAHILSIAHAHICQ